MRSRDLRDRLIPEKLSRVAPAAERVPALHHDALFLNERHHVLFLIVGMDLVLHKGRHDGDLREEGGQFLHVPVGKAERADLSLGHIGLHGFVGLHVVRSGVVQEHHVDVADVQLF